MKVKPLNKDLFTTNHLALLKKVPSNSKKETYLITSWKEWGHSKKLRLIQTYVRPQPVQFQQILPLKLNLIMKKDFFWMISTRHLRRNFHKISFLWLFLSNLSNLRKKSSFQKRRKHNKLMNSSILPRLNRLQNPR